MKILNFNIEYGGYDRKIPISKYADIIIDNKVDVFFCTEPQYPDINSKTKKPNYDKYGINIMDEVINILEKKGLKYYHIEATGMPNYVSIVSKYPIKKTRNKFIFKINIPDYPEDVILIPIHLDDSPFTFYSIRGIKYEKTPMNFKNKDEIVKLSYNTKSKDIENILSYIKRYPDKKYIIAGDFNEPSHLDDPKNEWIISKKFKETNLIDTYRFIQESKNTTKKKDKWGYNIEGSTCCDEGNNEPKNRIDFIYVKNMDVVDSKILKKYKDFSDHLPILSIVDI
jgi:hypothetical protein